MVYIYQEPKNIDIETCMFIQVRITFPSFKAADTAASQR